MYEQIINVDSTDQAVSLFGSFDENIRLIEKEFSVDILNRGGALKVCGDEEQVSKAVKAIEGLIMLLNKGEALNEQNVRYCISLSMTVTAISSHLLLPIVYV